MLTHTHIRTRESRVASRSRPPKHFSFLPRASLFPAKLTEEAASLAGVERISGRGINLVFDRRDRISFAIAFAIGASTQVSTPFSASSLALARVHKFKN